MRGLLDLPEIHLPVAKLLEGQLEQVSLIFERQLASDLTAVNTLCMHIEQYRGKMLRPTLVLLAGLAAGGKVPDVRCQASDVVSDAYRMTPGASSLTDNHRIVAAVTEMIHMATLVHDDVLDEADVRRSGATVNHLWGNETAVMLGDYLISNAFHLCSTMGDPAINLALGEVTNTLCEGELIQLHHRDDFSIDEETYFEIIRRKTASLIGECCRLGASLSGADEPVEEALKSFGMSLGIAFQIQDDLLDLIGDDRVVGKSLGKDLAKGKLTLPITQYMASADPSERDEALGLLAQRPPNAVQQLRGRLIESGAVDRTRRTAERIVAEAKAKLAQVPPGAATALLHTLADGVVQRTW
jgi:octaprenyl-diphosphate synthase